MMKQMKQHGGEGKGKYKGTKGSGKAKQHGGEGSLGAKAHKPLNPTAMKGYCGPGRYL